MCNRPNPKVGKKVLILKRLLCDFTIVAKNEFFALEAAKKAWICFFSPLLVISFIESESYKKKFNLGRKIHWLMLYKHAQILYKLKTVKIKDVNGT